MIFLRKKNAVNNLVLMGRRKPREEEVHETKVHRLSKRDSMAEDKTQLRHHDNTDGIRALLFLTLSLFLIDLQTILK